MDGDGDGRIARISALTNNRNTTRLDFKSQVGGGKCGSGGIQWEVVVMVRRSPQE